MPPNVKKSETLTFLIICVPTTSIWYSNFSSLFKPIVTAAAAVAIGGGGGV